MGYINEAHSDLTVVANPPAGMTILGFDIDGKLKKKDSDGLITDLEAGGVGGGGGGTGSKNIVMGRIFTKATDADMVSHHLEYPIVLGIPPAYSFGNGTWVRAYANPQFNDLLTRFSNYKDFKFKITETGGYAADELQFVDTPALIAHLNANLTNDGTYLTNDFEIICYATVTPGRDEMRKIHGVNLGWTQLRGRGKNYRRAYAMQDSYTSGIDTIVSSIYANKYTHAVTPLEMTAACGTLWVNGSKKTKNGMYNLYPAKLGGASSFITAGTASIGLRYVFDINTGTFQPFNLGIHGALFTVMGSLAGNNYYLVKYTGLIGGGAPAVNDISKDGVNMYVEYIGGGEVTSRLSIHVMVSQADPRYVAFLIKPIGIDTFNVPYIVNQTGIRLYGMFYRKDKLPVIREIVVPVDTIGYQNNRTWQIRQPHYAIFERRGIGSPYNTTCRPDNYNQFRFFYGYPDGTISELSSEVFQLFKQRGTKFKRMLR